MDASEIAEILALQELPQEGGLYAQTLADGRSTAIYYLIEPPAFSALHRLDAAEVFHFYAGAPAQMLLLSPDGSVAEPVLGTDLAAGERPQVVVPAGTWQGTSSRGPWTLLGTTMAPPFTWEGFELGSAALADEWPQAARRIAELVR